MTRMRGLFLAAAAVLALAACGSGVKGIGDPPAPTGPVVRAGALELTVPLGFRHYAIRGGGYRTGTRPPVIGVVTTDHRLKGGFRSSFVRWSRLSSKGPPASRVALALTLWLAIGPGEPVRLHLPLSLRQPWFVQPLRNEAHGYRWGYLSFHRQLYEVFFWSGGRAGTHDRAAVLRALASIRPAPESR